MIKFASVLTGTARRYERPARYGGEEFVVWLPHLDMQETQLIAQRIHDHVSRVQVAEKSLTVSIGVASLKLQGQEPESFLERMLTEADTALYEAKNLGRNRTVCFADL